MKIKTLASAAVVLGLGLAAWITPIQVQAQPLWDRVNVNLPYTVTIGEKVLQPGEYVIQQLSSASGSRVLLIYSDSGMRFETSAMTIPCLDINTARDTRVILHHFGNDYYFDKIWIQGKDYGYEFPLPNSVKQREKEAMQPVSVAAAYQSVPAETATETKQTTTEAAAAPATPAPVTTAEAAPPPPPPPPAEANREEAPAQEAPPAKMPTTSAGWLMLLLGGGALSGVGAALRRLR